MVIGHKRRQLGPGEFAESFVDRIGRHLRIKPQQRSAAAPPKSPVRIVSLRCLFPGAISGPRHAVAYRFEPLQRGVFDDRFGESSRSGMIGTANWT